MVDAFSFTRKNYLWFRLRLELADEDLRHAIVYQTLNHKVAQTNYQSTNFRRNNEQLFFDQMQCLHNGTHTVKKNTVGSL